MRYDKRPISTEDFCKFYGVNVLPFSLKGYSFYVNDELVAIAGIRYMPDGFLAFSDIKDGFSAPKKTIYKAALEIMDFYDSLKLPLVALPKSTASVKFLERLGFVMSSDGESFIYG